MAWAPREAKLLGGAAGDLPRDHIARAAIPASLEFQQVALSGTLVCIVALGQALLIIGRQIDLSVGAIVAWSAFVSALWLSEHPDSS